MKFFKWENNRFKVFNLTIFRMSMKKDVIRIYLLFIPIIRLKNEFSILSDRIKENSNFDIREYDEKISSFCILQDKNDKEFSMQKIIYLATELYDTGGHTKCLVNQIKSLNNDYEQCLFLTKKTSTYKNAPKEIKTIEKYAKICGIDTNYLFYKNQAVKLYNAILDYGAKTIFVYIHPDDILATLVLSLVKKNTDINIIFFNHASHYPNLGMTFADLILEGMPSALKITNDKRHLYNCKIIGLQSKAEGETVYSSVEDVQKLRKKYGIKENEIMTISGGASYKFFNENKSEYFEMIKRLLKERKSLKHVVMTCLTQCEQKIVDDIFKNSEEENRLIILPLSPEYEKYFQAADLFIDSFPVSSALTQIDLMRLKTPTIVKINKEHPEWSFHEYMPENYPYMFEKIEDMERAILHLLDSSEERQKIINSNYDFWLKTYESNSVKQRYIDYINSFSNEIKLINFNNIPYKLQLETRNWRNSKQVTDFFKIKYIDEKTHINWLESLKKENPNNIAFLIQYNYKPIGVTYFHSINYETNTCDWGIYIYEKNYRGKKIGDKVLKQCLDYAKTIGIQKIYLDVLSTNLPARKLYEHNGFEQLKESNDNFIRYEKTIV